MDAGRQIKARFEGIFSSLAEPVLWVDQRRDPPETRLSGYLTKGSGPEAGPEFRFRERVPGLEPGATLSLLSDGQRWRVLSLALEDLEGQILFLSARVENVDGPEAAPLAEGLDGLLQGLAQCLAESTLDPLNRADAAEALARLPQLCARPDDPAHALRLKARLSVLRDRFKACPQVSHRAQGLLLKLEAFLKRQGLQ